MVVLSREQLEDRLAALHRASLELVSALSLRTVLERIAQLAREQAGARYAALGVMDEEGKLVEFIPVGMEPEEMARISHRPVGKGLLGMVRTNPQTVRVADICTDPRSAGFPTHHPPMQSFLGVPIMAGDQLLGQLYLTDKQDFPEFTEQDERVIETLAAYAAVAITNARLYEELLSQEEILTRRNEDLALLNGIAEALTGSLDIDSILEQTLTHVMDYLDVETGEIFLREDGEKVLRLALHRGDAPEAFFTKDHFQVGEGVVGVVAESGKPLINLNPRTEVRFLRKAVVEAGFECVSLIPLTSRSSVVGVMGVATRKERSLDERELQVLMAIGAWAGITIENARLHRQARRLAVLEERERIGMDLHDGIIQSIYGVGLALEYARMALDDDPRQAQAKIEQSIEALNATIRDIRTYILDLRPRQFHGEDLKQGLQRLVEEFEANTNIRAALVAPDSRFADFPSANAMALFHICQEALANAAKHSQARNVDVHLWTAKDRVLLEVSDDGAGFDLRKMSATLGHGLSNMQMRARKVEGDVEITSYPGEGTTVLAWVPRNA